jgi:tetratricopeptide (TPR) repeat protein
MSTRKQPVADRKDWTFGQLLTWHMDRGTRPNGSPTTSGRRWIAISLAHECGLKSDRVVRAWRSDEYPPDDIETIERVLFGENDAYAAWKNELREAWSRAKHARDTSSAREPSTGAGIEPPDLCLGRDADTELLLAALRGPKDVVGIILGPAGIGKTTLTRQVAASPELAAHFGGRRWFVALETALDRSGLRERIVVALSGKPGEPTAFDQACRALADGGGLLVLDNLETPWEADMAGVQDDLRRLAAIPGLSLLASLRGTVPPDSPAFTHRVVLDPLPEDAARALFMAHALNIAPDDPRLADFLRALGGIPLAIELVARRAARQPDLAELWDQYEVRGPALARHPHLPEGRLTSVIRSIDLSWQSTRLHEPGRHLFRLLGASPAGLARPDREALLGEAALEAAEQVLEVGLAVARDGRLDLLPPVRGYALVMTPPEPQELDRWCRHFLALAEVLGSKTGKAGSGALIERLAQEVPNVEAVFAAALAADRRAAGVVAAYGYHVLLLLTGLGRTVPLQAAADACRQAEDFQGEANCTEYLGDIALARSRHDAARAAYEQALPLHRQVGDVLGEANCIRSLGSIALARSQYDAARAAFEQALPLYRRVGAVRGEANCIQRLGDIAQVRSQYDAARAACEQAMPLYRQVGSMQGEANCIKGLGDIALERSQHDTARAAYEQALLLYRQVGDVRGEANCVRRLGDIALARSQHDAASAAYEQALPLYRQVGAVLGEANCIRSLGDIALERSEHAAARTAWEQALGLYSRIPEPYSIGWTYHRLAGIATGAERAAHVAAARQAWASIERPDLVARLDALG